MLKRTMQIKLEPREGKYFIPLAVLRKEKLNLFRINELSSVIVLFGPDGVKVIHDLCPHMGGPLSQGHLCSETKTLVCPWHGYRFSTRTLCLEGNPNELIWIKPLAGEQADTFKTPHYKLREIPFQQTEDYLIIEVESV